MARSPFTRTRALPLCLIAITVALCGCAFEVRAKHVIMLDERSRLLDPTGNISCTEASPELCNGKHLTIKDYKPLDKDQKKLYIENLVNGLRGAEIKPDDPEKKKHLVIFVHGGLNTQTSSVERSSKLVSKITKEKYYPIFLNWRASLFFNYFDHLIHVRQGERWNDVAGWLSFPVVLAYDIGRSVFRAPLVWASEVQSGMRTFQGAKLPFCLDERQTWLGDQQSEHPGEAIGIVVGDDVRSAGETFFSDISGALLFPVRMITSPFIAGFGASAWDNLLRQTRLLTHPMEDYKKGHPEPQDPKGDLAKVMGAIQEGLVEVRRAEPNRWKVVLVGHSMGTIVINELLREFPDFPVDEIVYMASASTVADVEQSVIPYLRRNTSAKFYNLTLYHMAEDGERKCGDLIMRGSLLNWIDSFFANPMTPKEKTMGQHVNFLRTEQIFTPDDLRGRVYQKEFRYGNSVSATDPQKHGDFDRCPFWNEKFYSLEESKQFTRLPCSED